MSLPSLAVRAQEAPVAPAEPVQDGPRATEPVPAELEKPSAVATAAEKAAAALSLGPLKLSMFVDAYAAYQTNGKGTFATRTGHRAFTGQSATLRSENGFSLAFLGIDAEYDSGSFGAVANFRFGQAASIFHYQASSENDAVFGVDHLTQAYLLYRPVPSLQIDLGMFISPFGYEALESYKNPNYTISALYVYGQPNWHMGGRATWRVDDAFTLVAMVFNGTNNISETQQQSGMEQSPSVGGGVTYQVNDALSFGLSGFAAMSPGTNDDGGFDGFADFVATLELDSWLFAVNADYIFTRDGAPDGGNRNFGGGFLTAGYRFNEIVGVAARGEYLRDQADFGDGDVWKLWTGTLTLDVEPVPHLPNLVVRWENRWERSNQRVFGKSSLGTEDTDDDTYRRNWYETVLGVVVTTAP
ncbi:MAG: outer membrane beta-barrel protein [Polyangiales bacterium]